LKKLCFRLFARFPFVFSGSRECAYSNAHTVSCEKRIYDINAGVHFYQEKMFHRLESDSARNNIQPNNKQKPEIIKKHREKNMSIWPASLSVKVVSKLMSCFSP